MKTNTIFLKWISFGYEYYLSILLDPIWLDCIKSFASTLGGILPSNFLFLYIGKWLFLSYVLKVCIKFVLFLSWMLTRIHKSRHLSLEFFSKTILNYELNVFKRYRITQIFMFFFFFCQFCWIVFKELCSFHLSC